MADRARRPTAGPAEHGSGRGRAVRLGGAHLRGEDRLHRERDEDPWAVAELPPDSTDRRPDLRAMARAPASGAAGALRGQRARQGPVIFVTLGTNEAPF